MNIHKLETHQHEIPYFMLPRETVNLITNPDSLAIWSYLQSKPKNWKLIETQLRERFGLGRKRYLDAMRHLRDLGLYEVKRYKDDDNRFTGSYFHIYHLPQVRHSTLVENDTCIKEKESLKEKESFTLEQDTPLPPMGAVEQPAPVKLKVKNSDDQEHKFNLFWSLYPRKTSKQAAVKAWHRLKPSNDLFDKIMHALSKHCVSDGWQRDGGQYIPHPSTWINGRRWDDELPVNLPQVRHSTRPAEPDFNDTTWAQNMDDGL